MIRIISVLTLFTVLFIATGAAAKTVEGVNLPDQFDVEGTSLMLNGAGVRSKFFMDLYVGALYLVTSSTDGDAVTAADEPMNIRLAIISSLITSEKMVEATNEGFENSTGGNTGPIKPHIDAFMNVFKEEIKEGDLFDISYKSGTIRIAKNGDEKAAIDGGLAFKKAVFGIWLSENPAQESLKEEMLGD